MAAGGAGGAGGGSWWSWRSQLVELEVAAGGACEYRHMIYKIQNHIQYGAPSVKGVFLSQK